MYFVGIDLAWSEKNNTGISILKGNKKRAEVVYSSIVGSDEEILKIIKSKIDKIKRKFWKLPMLDRLDFSSCLSTLYFRKKFSLK